MPPLPLKIILALILNTFSPNTRMMVSCPWRRVRAGLKILRRGLRVSILGRGFLRLGDVCLFVLFIGVRNGHSFCCFFLVMFFFFCFYCLLCFEIGHSFCGFFYLFWLVLGFDFLLFLLLMFFFSYSFFLSVFCVLMKGLASKLSIYVKINRKNE